MFFLPPSSYSRLMVHFVIAVLVYLHAGVPVHAEVLGGAASVDECTKKNASWLAEPANKDQIAALKAKGITIEIVCADPNKSIVSTDASSI